MNDEQRKLRVVIGTTTGFHLRRLAALLQNKPIELTYFSYVPRFRLRRDGISDVVSISLFERLLPLSALALAPSVSRLRSWATEKLFRPTDLAIANRLPPCDVFIGLSSLTVLAAREAKRRFGATVILERGSRHVLSQNSLVVAGGGAPLSDAWIQRELDGYAVADYISVLSGHALESFVEHGFSRERLFLNPLGVDLSVFRPQPRPSAPLKLLFTGAWSIRKGVDLLQTAMARRNNWTLTHVGAITDAPASNLPNIHHIGVRTHQQLALLMKDHHLLVLPSREDGFGMVLLEALAAGLPIVASQLTGAPDIRAQLHDPRYVEICTAGDAASLLAALDNMVSRLDILPPDRAILTEADQQHFSWSSYGERYWRFLQSIGAERERIAIGTLSAGDSTPPKHEQPQ
ncbi:glycosyltransferase family 4 protein [Bradyrhizobium sp. IC3195]|uniref:glycosyltransferase family 4 protein n=1 Tax=Bradyrhizobium sp. IC3195 TaxID=2793804 RepID=UPI001CD48ED0|nr:glycosyltransferase family 4 protein [Bradyrhizobium sp. IC3195]MCA1469237.1 glycosyltransferase family 4 protein [Bradyrhizobium sp. IC3195]